MALPTIPSSWTAPASCFASTNYYRVLLEGGFFSNMYGTPTPVLTGNSPTGECFPPSYTIDVPYLTHGGCPTGYTRACATAGPESNSQPVSTITCCPSVTGNVFSFMCKDNEYGCHATATEGVVWTGVITNIGIPTPTEQPVTRRPFMDEGIEAWGIKLLSVHSTTVAPTSLVSEPSPTTSTKPTSVDIEDRPSQKPLPQVHDGPSTGVIVGVSLGTALGVVLLALAAFIFYRRRRRSKTNQNLHPHNPPVYYPESVTQKFPYQHSVQEAPYQLDAHNQHIPKRPLWELAS